MGTEVKQQWTEWRELRCRVKVLVDTQDLRRFKSAVVSTKPAYLSIQPAVLFCLFTDLRSGFLRSNWDSSIADSTGSNTTGKHYEAGKFKKTPKSFNIRYFKTSTQISSDL